MDLTRGPLCLDCYWAGSLDFDFLVEKPRLVQHPVLASLKLTGPVWNPETAQRCSKVLKERRNIFLAVDPPAKSSSFCRVLWKVILHLERRERTGPI